MMPFGVVWLFGEMMLFPQASAYVADHRRIVAEHTWVLIRWLFQPRVCHCVPGWEHGNSPAPPQGGSSLGSVFVSLGTAAAPRSCSQRATSGIGRRAFPLIYETAGNGSWFRPAAVSARLKVLQPALLAAVGTRRLHRYVDPQVPRPCVSGIKSGAAAIWWSGRSP